MQAIKVVEMPAAKRTLAMLANSASQPPSMGKLMNRAMDRVRTVANVVPNLLGGQVSCKVVVRP
ncbi:hypothetical protein D3C85_1501380 [compost metagenome]